MKQAIITGNITRDAVMRTAGKDQVASFSVAVNDRRTKEAIFFDCSYWGVRGEKVAPYLTKGTTVSVIGELGRREHEGKTYITINVSDLTLAGGGGERRAPAPSGQADSYGNSFSRELDDADSIPF